jgi:transporter family-2 protein
MTKIILFCIMFCAGVLLTVQPSINARLAQKTGILESACISFMVGTTALLLITLTIGPGSLKGVNDAAWWELIGGLFGAFYVSVVILVVPRLGTAAAMGITIAAQLITGLVLDHFGMFGFTGAPLDMKRLMAACLLVFGAVIMMRN